MWVWLRVVLALMVLLTPGSFFVLLAYVAARTLRAQWQRARVQAQANGGEVSLKEVVATLHLRDLVREARGAF